MVSSRWSGQRGEFPVLHHSDGCVQLHYAQAAGSPSFRGPKQPRRIGLVTLANVNGSGPSPDTGLASDQWVSHKKQQWSDR